MLFLLNIEKKIIFGWSAKCGCTHIKNLWFYLNNIKGNDWHNRKYSARPLPQNISEYTIIIFTRNPYKRLVSGFLDKYNKNGELRSVWGLNKKIIFKEFVDILVTNDFSKINRHHFTPQTSERYNDRIFDSKSLKFFDICNIDYVYIEELFDKKIEKHIIEFRGPHQRNVLNLTNNTTIYKKSNNSTNINKKTRWTNKSTIHSCTKQTSFSKDEYNNQYVYNLNMDTYYLSKIDTKYFYNEEIKKKVFNYYKKDFIIFYENGIDYINSPF